MLKTITYKRWLLSVEYKYSPMSRASKYVNYGKFKSKEEALAYGERIRANERYMYVGHMYAFEKEFSFQKEV